MGYGAMVWAVDLDRLRAEIGSGDAGLAARHGASFELRQAEVQEFIDDELQVEGAVTLTDIARHMIMAEPYDQRLGFAYGYFLQHLCRTHGELLDNQGWMPVRVSYPTTVDDFLAGEDLLAEGFHVWDLLFGGPPVDLPPIDGFPGIGHRERGTLAEPARRLSHAGRLDFTDPNLSDAVYTVFQWLAQADREGRSLVGFFH